MISSAFQHPEKDIQLIHPMLRDANHILILFMLRMFWDNDMRLYQRNTSYFLEIIVPFGTQPSISEKY